MGKQPTKKYLNVKIDESVIRETKAAAAVAGKQLNEHVEDVLKAAQKKGK